MAQKRRQTGVCRQNAAPNGSETQVQKRGEAGGFRHESREQRALPIGSCGARQPQQQGITDPALLAPDRGNGLSGALTMASRPNSPTRLTPTLIGAFELTPNHPESDTAS